VSPRSKGCRDLRPAMKERVPAEAGFYARPPVRVDRGMLRVSVFTGVPALLRLLNQDPDKVLGDFGLDPALLNDPDNMLPFATAGALLKHCVAKTGCAHFGLLLGQQSNPATLGMIEQLLLCSADVGTALSNLVHHLHHHDRGAIATLAVAGDLVEFGYHIIEHDVPARDQFYAGALAVTCRIMRSLCGKYWHPSEILLPFKIPKDTRPFSAFFKAPVRFDQEQATLDFPAVWLKQPLRSADNLACFEVERLLKAEGSFELTDQVSRTVTSLLFAGGRGRASEEAIACALAMSRRTLIRRLRIEGSSFNEIVRAVHQEISCQLLGDTGIPIADIASMLGYAGASSFTRAFKTWTGSSPAIWRRRNARV
jgi:AraC-like DNA-binding protein